MKTLNNPFHPKWSGSRDAIRDKREKREALIAKANDRNPTRKSKSANK